ncbi:MAG: HAD-IIA family hydrolase [Actinomycetes bacterium]
MTVTTLRGCDQPLAVAYDTALLDLDGVVYIGEQPVAGAAAALEAARRKGMSTAFVTNNASRTAETIAAHLVELGVPARPDEVVTSSMAAATLLAAELPAGSTVLVVGGEGLHAAVRERGLVGTEVDAEAVIAVVQGYGPNVSWRLLAEAALAIQRGVPWVATNLDTTLPSPRGLLPGNGSLVAALVTATGRKPISAGKPEIALHNEAVRRSGARHPLVVGDRLDTDIEGAVRAATDSLLVLTGVTDAHALLAAPVDKRPTYIAADLSGLNMSHPAVGVDGRSAACRGWRASLAGNVIELARTAEVVEPFDALRAVVAAAWLGDGTQPRLRGETAALDGLGLTGLV